MAERKRLLQSQVDKIERMTKEGRTQSEIGDAVGLNVNQVAYQQKKLRLKASNRWNYPETASMDPIDLTEKSKEPTLVENIEEAVREAAVKEEPKMKKKRITKVTEQRMTLLGSETGFAYMINTSEETMKISPSYGPVIELEVEDLVKLGNELIEVAEVIQNLKDAQEE